MRYLYKHICKLSLLGITLLSITGVHAGNEDRIGSAGGLQLLNNPWSRSAAFSGANMASASPAESMFLNVAGMAFVRSTELAFTHVNYLSGSNTSINTVGLVQRVGETAALGLTVSSTAFGDIQRTTTEQPEGDGTTFSPSFLNIGVSFAKAFSNSIYGGVTFKVLTEAIPDLGMNGVAFDAGIKYVTGERDQIKFGITLKNVGPTMSFQGDGLSFQTTVPPQEYQFTSEVRSESYELPSLVSIGFSYDFLLSEKHELAAHGAFTANSFSSDQYALGLEYSFRKMVFLRAGYLYEEGILDQETRRIIYTGLSAGVGLEMEIGPKKTKVSVDYSYRSTDPFDGVHSIGARINIGKAE